jgi:hypothetical protein
MSEDGPLLSLDQVRAAAAVGRLPELAHQLVADRRWSSVEVLLTMAGTASLPLEEITEALRALLDAVSALPEKQRRAVANDLQDAHSHAAAALARRADRPPPLTDRERSALAVAATLYAGLAEMRRAAELFEKAGDDTRAADAWGALGELEQMEICLEREEVRRRGRLTTAEARRRFEVLVAGGERRAALAAAASLPETDLDSQDVRARARQLEARLCRGRGVSLRLPDGRVLRLAAAPALLGRDPGAEVPVREPTVSRRHALLLEQSGALALQDAGSRRGTLIGGVPLGAPVTLRGEGELALGLGCPLHYREVGAGCIELRGTRGLDRDLWALVGVGRVALPAVLPEMAVADIEFGEGTARLLRTAPAPIRVDGQLVGKACDLLHGDRLELPGGLRLEVL